jgi:hypothetical protein
VSLVHLAHNMVQRLYIVNTVMNSNHVKSTLLHQEITFTLKFSRATRCESFKSYNIYFVYHKIHGAGVAQAVYCLTMDWTTGRSRFDPWQGQTIFPLPSVSRPTLGPTQPPVQWIPGILSPGVKRGRGVMLTTHPHLVPWS